MYCETCGCLLLQVMQSESNENAFRHWCPNCGTLRSEDGSGKVERIMPQIIKNLETS